MAKKKKKQAEFQQKLIHGYQAMTKNKKLKAELDVWEDTLRNSCHITKKEETKKTNIQKS